MISVYIILNFVNHRPTLRLQYLMAFHFPAQKTHKLVFLLTRNEYFMDQSLAFVSPWWWWSPLPLLLLLCRVDSQTICTDNIIRVQSTKCPLYPANPSSAAAQEKTRKLRRWMDGCCARPLCVSQDLSCRSVKRQFRSISNPSSLPSIHPSSTYLISFPFALMRSSIRRSSMSSSQSSFHLILTVLPLLFGVGVRTNLDCWLESLWRWSIHRRRTIMSAI